MRPTWRGEISSRSSTLMMTDVAVAAVVGVGVDFASSLLSRVLDGDTRAGAAGRGYVADSAGTSPRRSSRMRSLVRSLLLHVVVIVTLLTVDDLANIQIDDDAVVLFRTHL